MIPFIEMKLVKKDFLPEGLKEIGSPPEKIYIRGEMPKEGNKILAIVGSRKNTEYGEKICRKLIKDLAKYPITIVSGLALGIDSIAHDECIKNNMQTVSVLGNGLLDEAIYPKTNYNLAQEILKRKGGLICEYENERVQPFMFPRRNRLIVGLSDAVLVIEAAQKSGTLITARLAIEESRDVLVTPSNVGSSNSEGSNELIKDGAIVITSYKDILLALGLEELS